MVKVLFVCLGNICRSPTAEGVFRHQLNGKGIKDGFTHSVYIDSAGTAGFHMAASPDKRSQLTALKYGVDIGDLQARKLSLQDYRDFDYILTMDNQNLSNIKNQCPEKHQHKIHLFMSFAENCPGITEVPDPYQGEINGFDKVYNFINRASLGLIKHLENKQQL